MAPHEAVHVGSVVSVEDAEPSAAEQTIEEEQKIDTAAPAEADASTPVEGEQEDLRAEADEEPTAKLAAEADETNVDPIIGTEVAAAVEVIPQNIEQVREPAPQVQEQPVSKLTNDPAVESDEGPNDEPAAEPVIEKASEAVAEADNEPVAEIMGRRLWQRLRNNRKYLMRLDAGQTRGARGKVDARSAATANTHRK